MTYQWIADAWVGGAACVRVAVARRLAASHISIPPPAATVRVRAHARAPRQIKPVVLESRELLDECRALGHRQLGRLVAKVGLHVTVEDHVVPLLQPRLQERRGVSTVLGVQRCEEQRVDLPSVAVAACGREGMRVQESHDVVSCTACRRPRRRWPKEDCGHLGPCHWRARAW